MAADLAKDKVGVAVLRCPTIKPLDEAAIVRRCAGTTSSWSSPRTIRWSAAWAKSSGEHAAAPSGCSRRAFSSRGCPMPSSAGALPTLHDRWHQPREPRRAHPGMAGLMATTRNGWPMPSVSWYRRHRPGDRRPPGRAAGRAEIATALYTRHLKFDPADPTWPDRDRVVLSNGHRLDAALRAAAPERLRGLSRSSRSGASAIRFRTARPSGVQPGPRHRGSPPARSAARASPTPSAWRWPSISTRASAAAWSTTTYAFVGDGCLQRGIGREMISLAGPPAPGAS